jgi:hypothetical protein
MEVIMLSPATARMDDASGKWAMSIIREKKLVITAFLNEYGENATWEEWRSFLHEHRVKGFDWMRSMD